MPCALLHAARDDVVESVSRGSQNARVLVARDIRHVDGHKVDKVLLPVLGAWDLGRHLAGVALIRFGCAVNVRPVYEDVTSALEQVCASIGAPKLEPEGADPPQRLAVEIDVRDRGPSEREEAVDWLCVVLHLQLRQVNFGSLTPDDQPCSLLHSVVFVIFCQEGFNKPVARPPWYSSNCNFVSDRIKIRSRHNTVDDFVQKPVA